VGLLDVDGLPECALPADLPSRLPAATPPPPWDCAVRAVVWVQRGASPLPASSPYAAAATGLVLGAVVEYLESPVGPYREVFAGLLLRRAGSPAVHVPFMSVDSLPSLHGGRAHWALPKCPARFDGDVAAGQVRAEGGGWSVEVGTRTSPLPVPLVARLRAQQGGRTARVQLRGRGRAARVQVRASGPTLSGWLGEGVHAGVVGTGRLLMGPAVPR
jgi:hypothetical protein